MTCMTACRSESPIPAENASSAGNVASAPVEPPRLTLPLERRDLLLAAIEARSAAALGADDREAQAALDNRRFQFRMRLGCEITPPDGPRPAEAVYDPDRRRVNLSAAPDISLDDPFVASLAGEGLEAAEGFWVRRPWILTPSCVGADAGGGIGLVQFFSAEQPRTERRGGRPYETRASLPEGAEGPTPGKWDLVLRGRLRTHDDGRVILCRAQAEGVMPVCLISVVFEQVSVEDAETGEELVKWGRG